MAGRKIRVVQVLCALERGGAERLVADLCRAFDPDRIELRVATVMGGGPLEPVFQALGIPVMQGGRRRRTPGLRSLARLRDLFHRFRPDVVHTHLFAGDTWGRLAALGPRRPVLISTEHNLNLSERWHHRMLKRRLAPFTDRIVAVSEAVRRHAIEQEGLPAGRIEVIPNGIDLSRFPPVRAGLPGPGHRLVTVGRLVPQKGIDVLIDALALAPGLSLTVVGDGPERGSLEARARALGLHDRVRFLGDRSDIPELLREADLLVQPSRWEGFGLTVIEAMATGLPVVASAVDGMLELIEPGGSGLLVERESPRALADVLLELADDPVRREAMGRAGAARAHGIFGIDAVAARYLDLYLRCIDARSMLQ